MLISLSIRDMALIDRVELTFDRGLTVLTGETGAGKSILLDALGFALGWRGRGGTVRAGAAEGEVTAVFDLPNGHTARAVLDEAGLPAGDELILRRTVSADGRSGAFVNDRRASAEVLRLLADTLLELHGQQDDRGLLNPRGHRQLLDDFAGADAEREAVRAAHGALTAAGRALAEAQDARTAAASDAEFLRFAVAELDKLSPQPGEDEALDARRRTMQAAARIGEDIARAQAALGPQGAEGPMADALRWLEGAADRAEGRLDAALTALGRALNELAEAEQQTGQALEAMQFDPGELERTEERLFALRALARKHQVATAELPDLAVRLRTRLEALDESGQGIARLKAAQVQAQAAYDAAAAALSVRRREAAGRLDKAMAAELVPLKLDRAIFTTSIAPGPAGPDGADDVSFTVSTNPGAPPGPLDRIASGGELSRFLLALKVCLAGRSAGLAMIFDEIDRGVGGATADAVGRRLEALARGGQVLVVTHSPQVAARAAHHLRVEKSVSGGRTQSKVVALAPGERIGEIARMLAGDRITDAARDAARSLVGDTESP